MSRYIFQGVFQDGNGQSVASGTVSVYLAGTTTAASVYEASSGGTAVNSVTSDTDGSFYFYVDTDDYNTSQKFKATFSKTNFESKTIDNIVVFPTVFASNAETATGTETLKAVTPAGVAYLRASNTETTSGSSSAQIVTPSGLRNLLGNIYYPESSETDQGVAGSGTTINTYVDAIGSDYGVIFLRHNSDSATTTYTLTTSEAIPSNIVLCIEPGAIIDGAGTLTIGNASLDFTLHQCFGSSITVVFSEGSVPAIYPEWWGIDGTTDETEIGKAITAAANVKCVKLQGKTYTLTSAGLTLSTDDMAFLCDAGLATLSSAADIDAVTVSARTVIRNIKAITSKASPTKSGFKFTDGAKNCDINNIKSLGFCYGFELNSSTSTGVAYNELKHLHTNDCTTADVYITKSGDGWVNENHFFGGNIHTPENGRCANISVSCNQNTFNNVSFEGGPTNDFAIIDHGVNIFQECRYELRGHGIYVHNDTANNLRMTRIDGGHWSLNTGKVPVVVADGRLMTNIWFNSASAYGYVTEGNPLDTTVDQDSASGQTVLYIASTTSCYKGQHVGINVGGAREEWGVIDSIDPGVSVTLDANLLYTHTALDADTVKTYGVFYGATHNALGDGWEYTVFHVYGKKVARLKHDGVLELDATVSENAW